MRRSHIFILVALLTACASSNAPKSPSVTITQVSVVEPIRAAAGTQVPVDYRLDMTNPFDHPVTLTSVEVETVGFAGGYAMKRVRHRFSHVIPARSTSAIDLRAWVQPLQVSEQGDIVTSVMLRGVARFESNGQTTRTAFTTRARQ